MHQKHILVKKKNNFKSLTFFTLLTDLELNFTFFFGSNEVK